MEQSVNDFKENRMHHVELVNHWYMLLNVTDLDANNSYHIHTKSPVFPYEIMCRQAPNWLSPKYAWNKRNFLAEKKQNNDQHLAAQAMLHRNGNKVTIQMAWFMWIQNTHNALITAWFANTTNCRMWIHSAYAYYVDMYMHGKPTENKHTQGRSIYIRQWFLIIFIPWLFTSGGRGFHTPLFPTGCSICAGRATAAIRWATLFCIYVWL